MSIPIQDLRENYLQDQLEIEEVKDSPFEQFQVWLDIALAAKIKEPNAMTLATADATGKPSARIVLLKGIREDGFVFYTNYESAKGQQLAANPYAALVFSWLDLEKQIRIEGIVEKLTFQDSEAYFQSRPKGSQIGAWASPQSRVIEDRRPLEQNVKELEKTYANASQLPCPTHWGGYIVKANKIEFWQGRSSRLHDRICYTLEADGNWKKVRLAP